MALSSQTKTSFDKYKLHDEIIGGSKCKETYVRNVMKLKFKSANEYHMYIDIL